MNYERKNFGSVEKRLYFFQEMLSFGHFSQSHAVMHNISIYHRSHLYDIQLEKRDGWEIRNEISSIFLIVGQD